jgi:hypothetical protein
VELSKKQITSLREVLSPELLESLNEALGYKLEVCGGPTTEREGVSAGAGSDPGQEGVTSGPETVPAGPGSSPDYNDIWADEGADGDTGLIDCCYYCGWFADTRDHIKPRTWSGDIKRFNVPTVPCCNECNSLLGDSGSFTPNGRRRYLIHKYKKRYQKRLAVRAWTEAEILALGPGLRRTILAKQSQRNIIRFKLRNLNRGGGLPLPIEGPMFYLPED